MVERAGEESTTASKVAALHGALARLSASFDGALGEDDRELEPARRMSP
jgi:hypothetical protein